MVRDLPQIAESASIIQSECGLPDDLDGRIGEHPVHGRGSRGMLPAKTVTKWMGHQMIDSAASRLPRTLAKGGTGLTVLVLINPVSVFRGNAKWGG